jgi:hypothetical protein
MGASIPAGPTEAVSLEATVAKAIDEFTPPWKPPENELGGWIIGIDPACGGSVPAERACDELGLLTAAHLYQLALSAGGVPILTRADLPQCPPEPGDAERRARTIQESKCDLCVSVRYEPGDGGGAVYAGEQPGTDNRGRLLGECMRSSLGDEFQWVTADAVAHRSICQLLLAGADAGRGDVPACEVRLACPDRITAGDKRFQAVAQANARLLYTGISKFVAEHLGTPPASGAPKPDAGSAATATRVPDVPRSSLQSRLRRLGRSIWPDGRLPDDKLDWFCRMFTRIHVTDRSLIHVETSASVEEGVVVLRGATNAPSVVAGLLQALGGVGVSPIRNQVRTLPDRAKLGDELFGACRVTSALTTDRPADRSGLQTQLLFGEPAFLLDRTEAYYLLHAGDGYWGWASAEAIEPMTAERFSAYLRHPRGAILEDVHRDRVHIPRGGRVPVVRTDADQRVVLLPDGATLTLRAAAVRLDDNSADAAAARVRAALDLVGAPYIFGGRSASGLDCSGLVTNVWARAGDQAARDAWQQAFAGSLVATRWFRQAIQPGDQVLFMDPTGKINHTGVAISATHVVHAAPPSVQIGSLNSGDRLYDARLDRDFFMAKRP